MATADLKAGRVELKSYPSEGGCLVDHTWVWKPGLLTDRELAMIETPHQVFVEASCDLDLGKR